MCLLCPEHVLPIAWSCITPPRADKYDGMLFVRMAIQMCDRISPLGEYNQHLLVQALHQLGALYQMEHLNRDTRKCLACYLDLTDSSHLDPQEFENYTYSMVLVSDCYRMEGKYDEALKCLSSAKENYEVRGTYKGTKMKHAAELASLYIDMDRPN